MDTNGHEYTKMSSKRCLNHEKHEKHKKTRRSGKRENHEWTRMDTNGHEYAKTWSKQCLNHEKHEKHEKREGGEEGEPRMDTNVVHILV